MTPESGEVRSETIIRRKGAVSNQLFRNWHTGEYCVCIRGINGRWRWLSLHTKSKEDALNRIAASGIDKIVTIAEDDNVRAKAVEILIGNRVVTVDQVVYEWIADAKQRLHPSSLQHYRAFQKQFIRLFPQRTDIKTIHPPKLNAWINSAPTLTQRSRRRKTLKSLFNFAVDQGYRQDNPGKRLVMKTDDLTFEQMERKVKVEFTQAEYDQLLACEDIQGFWRWAIQLSWWLGLRVSDVCYLQWGSFCAVPGKLVVWQKKTRRRVELDLNDPVLGSGIVTQIIDELKAEATDAAYCFPKARAVYEKMQPYLVYEFRVICKMAGLDGTKTFHCLRKSAALRWKASGRSLAEIGMMLGHYGIANTQFYLETASAKQAS